MTGRTIEMTPYRAPMQHIFSLLLCLSASAGLAANPPEPLSAQAAFELPQPKPDAVIHYGEHDRQFGELRLPKSDGPFGIAVIIHGGCWLSDYDQGYMASFAQAITDLGWATWTIAYRRVGEPGGGWPNTFVDAGAAVDFVPELATRYPLDTERVIAIGHSAGGHLALWLAGRSRLPATGVLYTERPQPIHGVLALAAAADLEYLSAHRTCGNAATLLMDGSPEARPERYLEGSPTQLLPLGVPQILVNGELDETWSAPADRYFAAASNAGDAIETSTMAGAGHFELVVPNSQNWSIVREALVRLGGAIADE